jgi:ribosomal protein S3
MFLSLNFKLTQAQRDQLISTAKIGAMNGVPCVHTELNITSSARSLIRSVATSYTTGTPFETVMSLMAGATMRVTIYSSTNVVGRTNTAELEARTVIARTGELGDWVNYTDVDRAYAEANKKFGDGTLGLDIARFVEAYPDDLQDIFTRTFEKAEVAA